MTSVRHPLTSVIIPCYNNAASLGRAVESALNQTVPPAEIIVIDDGSTDSTELVAHSFGYPVRVLSQPNGGPAAARNRGLNASSGKYVAFLDADDYWLPGFIAAGQEFLEAHPEEVAVSVGQKFIQADGTALRPEFEFPHGHAADTPFGIEDFYSCWGELDHIRTGSCLIRRAIVEIAGGQREDLWIAEDLEYWAYLATFGKWGFDSRVFWVCDSVRSAAKTGWLKKNRARRRLCPTMANWQARILPRLQPKDMPGFLKVQGRVAAILAQNFILGGQRRAARNTVRSYGLRMPDTWLTRLIRVGDTSGVLGWHLACLLIQGREIQKALHMSVKSSLEATPPAEVTTIPSPEQRTTDRQTLAGTTGDPASGVSVIIPAFNSAHCLGRAIASALNQVPPPLEVIVVDDGSTDGTAALAGTFGDRIRLLRQENKGQGAARNAGLQVVRGEFVAFLDADDYWLPGFITSCTDFLRQHREAVAVSTGLRFLRPDGPDVIGPQILRSLGPRRARPWLLSNFFAFWGAHDHVRTGSVLIRRQTIEDAGLQQAHLRISQDLEYWGYLATFGPWGFVPEVRWVCDSERMALVHGWMRKYARRRKLCPTIESWQERIVSRLRPEQWPGFRRVRGRVAANFAQNHILARRFSMARDITVRYGAEMPVTWSSNILRLGCRFGVVSWVTACLLILLREFQKSAVWRMRGAPTLPTTQSVAPSSVGELATLRSS